MQGVEYQASSTASFSTLVQNYVAKFFGQPLERAKVVEFYCFEIDRQHSQWRDIAGMVFIVTLTHC